MRDEGFPGNRLSNLLASQAADIGFIVEDDRVCRGGSKQEQRKDRQQRYQLSPDRPNALGSHGYLYPQLFRRPGRCQATKNWHSAAILGSQRSLNVRNAQTRPCQGCSTPQIAIYLIATTACFTRATANFCIKSSVDRDQGPDPSRPALAPWKIRWSRASCTTTVHLPFADPL